MFRNERGVFVKDVNTPPTPLMIMRQHVQHVDNAKNQILYPHFGNLHFSNLQPFEWIVNGTSQN